MRHNMNHRKLNRTSSHRKSLFRNMTMQLIEHEQIVTTLPKAKEIRPIVEKMITLGKHPSLQARRQALAALYNDGELVDKLFNILGARYKDRSGGYTRIMRAGFRKGDSAPVAIIELVDRDVSARGAKDLARAALERAALNAE